MPWTSHQVSYLQQLHHLKYLDVTDTSLPSLSLLSALTALTCLRAADNPLIFSSSSSSGSSSSSNADNGRGSRSLRCLCAFSQMREMDISCSEKRLGWLCGNDSSSSSTQGGGSSSWFGSSGGSGLDSSGAIVGGGAVGSMGAAVGAVARGTAAVEGPAAAVWRQYGASDSDGGGNYSSGTGSCSSGCSAQAALQHSLTVLSHLTDLTSLRFNRRPSGILDHRVSCSPGHSGEWAAQHYCPLVLQRFVYLENSSEDKPCVEIEGLVFDIEDTVFNPDGESSLVEDPAPEEQPAGAAVAGRGGPTGAATAAVAGGCRGGGTAVAKGVEGAAAAGASSAAAAGNIPGALNPTLAAALAQLHQLQHLTWTSWTFSHGQLPELISGCSSLGFLDISYSSVATADLACLTMLAGLTSLTAACMVPHLGPDVVPVLLQLTGLAELDVYGNMLGTAGRGLTALRQLQRLDVDGNGIGRRGVEALCRVFGDALVVHYVGEEDPEWDFMWNLILKVA